MRLSHPLLASILLALARATIASPAAANDVDAQPDRRSGSSSHDLSRRPVTESSSRTVSQDVTGPLRARVGSLWGSVRAVPGHFQSRSRRPVAAAATDQERAPPGSDSSSSSDGGDGGSTSYGQPRIYGLGSPEFRGARVVAADSSSRAESTSYTGSGSSEDEDEDDDDDVVVHGDSLHDSVHGSFLHRHLFGLSEEQDGLYEPSRFDTIVGFARAPPEKAFLYNTAGFLRADFADTHKTHLGRGFYLKLVPDVDYAREEDWYCTVLAASATYTQLGKAWIPFKQARTRPFWTHPEHLSLPGGYLAGLGLAPARTLRLSRVMPYRQRVNDDVDDDNNNNDQDGANDNDIDSDDDDDIWISIPTSLLLPGPSPGPGPGRGLHGLAHGHSHDPGPFRIECVKTLAQLPRPRRAVRPANILGDDQPIQSVLSGFAATDTAGPGSRRSGDGNHDRDHDHDHDHGHGRHRSRSPTGRGWDAARADGHGHGMDYDA